MKRKWKTAALCALAAAGLTGCGEKSLLDPDSPVVISVWHYYNGAQQEAFDQLADEFNNTVGREKGIYVESFSQGTVTDLVDNILASIDEKPGADQLPNIFSAYADTANQVDQRGYVAALDDYFTEEELDRYVDGYLEEGRFSADGSLKIIPVAKSVELLMLNKTDWDLFAEATGTGLEQLSTIEGLCRTAEEYYEWSGKAFFGRDAMANYMLIGYHQLEGEMFAVKEGKVTFSFDREAIKKLWDFYYIPYIKGYFASKGRFRSDDIKTGDIICCVGSSSSATYFPTEVILNDEDSYPVEMLVMPCPQFQDGEAYAVQQGAGMLVTKAEEKEELASVEFLKWFTQDEQNLRFSTSSGYLPVTKSANQYDLTDLEMEFSENVRLTLESGMKTVRENEMYTTKAFQGGSDCRAVLESAMQERAEADRLSVEERMAEGMALEAAAEEFCREEYFNAWYEETKTTLEALLP